VGTCVCCHLRELAKAVAAEQAELKEVPARWASLYIILTA
jgi:hypothetical protein